MARILSERRDPHRRSFRPNPESARPLRPDQVVETAHRAQVGAGEVDIGIEDDPELGLARDDRLQKMHGVEPEASVDERRLGSRVDRHPARSRRVGDDGLDALEREWACHVSRSTLRAAAGVTSRRGTDVVNPCESQATVLFLRHGREAGKSAIPLGPFLAVGGVVALFWGDAVLDWYRELGTQ